MTPSRRPSPFRRALRATLLALAALAPLHASPVRAGWLAGDPTYMGFRIPEHRWSFWNASLNANGAHSSGPSFSGLSRIGSWGGGLGTRWGAGYDSDRLQHGWALEASANGGRTGRRDQQEFTSGGFERFESSRSLGQRVGAGASLRTYPWTVPVGLSLSFSNTLELSQSFTSGDVEYRDPLLRDVTTTSSGVGDRRYIGSVSAWLGVGQVRNVTSVHRALVFESRLLQAGTLTRPLSGGTRARLAALYSVESDLSFAHERSSKYFWRELERILREDGALAKASLDAWDVLRTLERLTVGRGLSRSTGFFIGPVVEVVTVRDRHTRKDSFSSVQTVADTVYSTHSDFRRVTVNERRDDVIVSLGAEFHRPLDPRWQLDAFSRFGIQEAGEFPTFTNSVSLGYDVTDRWFGTVRIAQFASGQGHSRRPDRWSVSLGAELVYFLEDAWALSLRADESQRREFGTFRRDGGFQLGITWIVSGFFEAPGLVEPMRPSPPTP